MLVVLVFSRESVAQNLVHHWETVVYDSMVWRYKSNTDPGTNWNASSFNDLSWLQGKGGIGYGDNDDRTSISPTISVFLRKKFTIINREKITEAILHADYDDGFIAYLNGVEIARSFMGNQTQVPFNQGSGGLHEAVIYQGQAPEGFVLSPQHLGLLVNGENTLAVQVHNESMSSSDLSSNLFFSVGISDNSISYLPTPTWFAAPLIFTSSNLPIISINTNGLNITDEPRILADMGIINNGVNAVNNLSDPFNDYNGKIGIEIRGESSQGLFPKKSYRIETTDGSGNNLNVSLLGMPPENDWVLYAPYSDKSMMRNVLTYKLSREMGNYAPRTRLVELVLNGKYEGVYVLIEKIKVDNNRVDIASLKPDDIAGEELTGGYLLRVDKLDANDFPGWQSIPNPQLPGENLITFQYYDPKGVDLLPLQKDYIQSFIAGFQSSLTMSGFVNPTTGYRKYLDVSSTIDFMLVNEIGKNIDGYIFSTYLYKEKDRNGKLGKLYLGPVWDFNLAFGNVNYLANAQYAPGWMWNDSYRMFWFRRLVGDPYFTSSMKCRWEELRSGILSNEYFLNTIDSIAAVLQEPQMRNYQRWPILGTYIWPNQYVGQTYQDEINFLKQWTLERLVWMDLNMPGNCDLITAIQYVINPDVTVFPNPFSKTVTVRLPDSSPFNKVIIYDRVGKAIFSVSDSATEFIWDGMNTDGNLMPAGIYFVVLYRDQQIVSRGKLVLVEH